VKVNSKNFSLGFALSPSIQLRCLVPLVVQRFIYFPSSMSENSNFSFFLLVLLSGFCEYLFFFVAALFCSVFLNLMVGFIYLAIIKVYV
jgi:hypothetical protein